MERADTESMPRKARPSPPADTAPIVGRSAFATLELSRGVLVARLAGPTVGEREASILAKELEEVLAEFGGELRVFVFDLSNVQGMCSLGLGLFIETDAKVDELGAQTIVYGLNRQLEDLFRMTRVDRRLRIARGAEELARLSAA
jgi:anti-anti-sigma factor